MDQAGRKEIELAASEQRGTLEEDGQTRASDSNRSIAEHSGALSGPQLIVAPVRVCFPTSRTCVLPAPVSPPAPTAAEAPAAAASSPKMAGTAADHFPSR